MARRKPAEISRVLFGSDSSSELRVEPVGPPAASAGDVAAGIAHALNNLLGLVHAAQSHLESASAEAIGAAQASLERAVRDGRFVSANLALLSLDERKLEAALEGGRFDWDRYEMASLQDALIDLGRVACVFPHDSPDLRADFSASLLRSLLTCAVAIVRRYASPDAAICIRLRVAPLGPDGCHLVSFAVVPEVASDGEGVPARRAPATESPFFRVPLGHLALQHFVAIADRVQASVLVDPGRGIRLDVRARPAGA